MCGHEVPANESTSESIKELCHGCREGSICVVAVLVYQGYNDGIERDVHHTIYGRITGDVRQEPCQDIPTKHTLSKLLDVLFSEAYHLEVPVYVMLAETPEVSAY